MLRKLLGRGQRQCASADASRSAQTAKSVEIPDDIVIEILSHLDPHDILITRLVNFQFKRVASSHGVWLSVLRDLQRLCPSLIREDDLKPSCSLIKRAIKMHRVSHRVWPSLDPTDCRDQLEDTVHCRSRKITHPRRASPGCLLEGGRWFVSLNSDEEDKHPTALAYDLDNPWPAAGSERQTAGGELPPNPLVHYHEIDAEYYAATLIARPSGNGEFHFAVTFLELLGATHGMLVSRTLRVHGLSAASHTLGATDLKTARMLSHSDSFEDFQGDIFALVHLYDRRIVDVRIINWMHSSPTTLYGAHFCGEPPIDGGVPSIQGIRVFPEVRKILVAYQEHFELYDIPEFESITGSFERPLNDSNSRRPCWTYIAGRSLRTHLSPSPWTLQDQATFYLTATRLEKTFVVGLSHNAMPTVETVPFGLQDIPGTGSVQLGHIGSCRGIFFRPSLRANDTIAVALVSFDREKTAHRVLHLPVGADKMAWLRVHFDEQSGRIVLRHTNALGATVMDLA